MLVDLQYTRIQIRSELNQQYRNCGVFIYNIVQTLTTSKYISTYYHLLYNICIFLMKPIIGWQLVSFSAGSVEGKTSGLNNSCQDVKTKITQFYIAQVNTLDLSIHITVQFQFVSESHVESISHFCQYMKEFVEEMGKKLEEKVEK